MARKPARSTQLRNLLTDIPPERKVEATRLAEEILLIQDKLDEAAADFSHEPIVEEYDNGGGQVGTRENPMHSAYIKLSRSRRQLMDALDSMREPEPPARYGLPDWLV